MLQYAYSRYAYNSGVGQDHLPQSSHYHNQTINQGIKKLQN